MWGIIPVASAGNRKQPAAFAKEVLPAGSRTTPDDEPRAVREYLLERMILGGADKICFVIAPGSSDILEHCAAQIEQATITYVVQPRPLGLCDAIFRVAPLVHEDEPVLVGLPDTIWFPSNGLMTLHEDTLSFLLFPVEHPELFDAVIADDDGNVADIQVKQVSADSHWAWGAFRAPGRVLHRLADLWQKRNRRDEDFGTLVNALIAEGGTVRAVRAGEAYVEAN